MLRQRLEEDLKAAMLAGDRQRVEVLRSMKSALLYATVAKGRVQKELGEEEILALFAKEAKKRQESADLYDRGGRADKAAAERAEKAIIESYLPKQVSDEVLSMAVDKALSQLDGGPAAMGKAIAAVKQDLQGSADGARIAAMVRARLDS